ncbi:hypothetical protein [Natronobacterium gregoryi]|uniref:Uncharacterized protein n=2 Tax=Natronobacterium gregoryi TaxID=44930 RepID=L0ADM1_NATGS|nr:hypothetical protein [Natronobacterium gregoryi]AFZ72008.1 hypothetical protein Natgr_0766 [Natronobacterium gregoryi SP2]ELY62716.1 hypothetical protein C490_17427 [Natronobacterium gregoryi SP2]PLK20860.1 hypothetical protein CYV19_07210 [Natronobacterium gregoryi SP2]SFJ19904.1 hypothetical protein SAMN05443661_11746 [Natronobacterium gregoryi]
MSTTDDIGVPERAYRWIFFGVVLYFVLVGYSAFTGNPLAMDAATVVFGVIALGLGVVLYRQSGGEPSAALAAAVFLVAGGLLQFAFLATDQSVIDDLSSLTVFAGVGLYLYTVWVDN